MNAQDCMNFFSFFGFSHFMRGMDSDMCFFSYEGSSTQLEVCRDTGRATLKVRTADGRRYTVDPFAAGLFSMALRTLMECEEGCRFLGIIE